VIGGIVSSAPIGPINLWVADAALRGEERGLAGFISGVVLCDVAYAALAAWGYHAFAQDARIALLLSLLAGGVLIALGVVLYARAGAARRSTRSDYPPVQPARQFMLGVVLMGANPAFLMFWVFAVDLLVRTTGIAMECGLLALFLAGVVAGDAAWFAGLTRAVRSGSGLLGSVALRRLQKALAFAFVAAGTYAIARGLTFLR
jgi:threonine/homoserine/homoserine lactone efflux protein